MKGIKTSVRACWRAGIIGVTLRYVTFQDAVLDRRTPKNLYFYHEKLTEK